MPPTPAIQRIVKETKARWPQLTFGFYNPRHIGSNPRKPWSQHAGSEPDKGWYGNAGDIHDPGDNYLSAVLDQVYAFLDKNRERFGIRVLLWRVEAHYDHIHVDCWPKMKDNWWYKPPAKGGTLVTYLADGTTSDTFAIDQEDEDMEVIKLGDQGPTVVKMQKALNGWAEPHPLEPLLVDGDFGPATRARLEDYQTNAANLPTFEAGVCGGITYSLLMEYVTDHAAPPTTTEGIQTGDDITITGTGVTIVGTIEENT